MSPTGSVYLPDENKTSVIMCNDLSTQCFIYCMDFKIIIVNNYDSTQSEDKSFKGFEGL